MYLIVWIWSIVFDKKTDVFILLQGLVIHSTELDWQVNVFISLEGLWLFCKGGEIVSVFFWLRAGLILLAFQRDSIKFVEANDCAVRVVRAG